MDAWRPWVRGFAISGRRSRPGTVSARVRGHLIKSEDQHHGKERGFVASLNFDEAMKGTSRESVARRGVDHGIDHIMPRRSVRPGIFVGTTSQCGPRLAPVVAISLRRGGGEPIFVKFRPLK